MTDPGFPLRWAPSHSTVFTVADPGGARGPCPPSPVKISHKKDGHRIRPHRFHVSPPPHPAAGSATDLASFLPKQFHEIERN